MADIYTMIRNEIVGRGGLKCYCCNPKTNRGKSRRRIMRQTNKTARTRLDKYLPIDY